MGRSSERRPPPLPFDPTLLQCTTALPLPSPTRYDEGRGVPLAATASATATRLAHTLTHCLRRPPPSPTLPFPWLLGGGRGGGESARRLRAYCLL